MERIRAVGTSCLLLILGSLAAADTLELADGTKVYNCYVRDEGVRIQFWRRLQDVGKPPETLPRSAIRGYKIERGPAWDAKPKLPDLSVLFLEMNPKLAGLHGRVQYDVFGRPSIEGAKALTTPEGERRYTHPEEAVRNLKLDYVPGEPITLTANVRNLGFADAKPFEYVWRIDGKEVARGRHARTLGEGEYARFTLRWHWQEGMHTASFEIVTDQPQIATINDRIDDPLWGWSLEFVVNRGRVEAWRQARTAYGTFSFEDFYRWHVDIMNLLFEAARYPSVPNGCRARVRLDRIVVTPDVDEPQKEAEKLFREDGIRYNQGMWIWQDDQDRKKAWEPASHEWRNQTEWSLPHELGHQLGLIDWYNTDYPGDERFVWSDTGEKVGHFMTFPNQMMHWHGPHVWGEVDAANLDRAYRSPRGFFGDYVFPMPAECFVRFTDVNGLPLVGAEVEVFQRGAQVDPNGQPGEDRGTKWWPVVEDGNFFTGRLSERPVMAGRTDSEGRFRLANRPAKNVKSLAGYERKDNPFGNMDVVGPRQLMLMKVTKDGRTEWFYIEAYQFNVLWYRGQRERGEVAYRTPFGSPDSPLRPASVSAVRTQSGRIEVRWQPAPTVREQNPLDWVVGYRVYLRRTSDGLDNRPWMPVATLGPEARSALIDPKSIPADNWWNSDTLRVAVAAIGFNGRESELVSAVVPK